MQVARIITEDTLTVTFVEDGVQYTVRRDEDPDKYNSMIEAIRAEDWEAVHDIANPVRKLLVWVSDSGRVRITPNVDGYVSITFDGRSMHSTLVNRMVDLYRQGLDVTPLALFMENLHQNPSKRSVDELYGFLERSNLPITPDGHFLAYKKVRGDYRDIHSGTFDNSVGKVCSMPRNQVDDEKERTCSSGLHFCSKEYLPHFGWGGGNRVVILKINPRDVVSIPIDYENAKGRCCRYEVVGEIEDERRLEGAYNDEFVKDDLDFEDDEPVIDDDEKWLVVDRDMDMVHSTYSTRDQARDQARHLKRWYGYNVKVERNVRQYPDD